MKNFLYNLFILPIVTCLIWAIGGALLLSVIGISGGMIFYGLGFVFKQARFAGGEAIAIMAAMVGANASVNAIFKLGAKYFTLRGSPSSLGIKKEEGCL